MKIEKIENKEINFNSININLLIQTEEERKLISDMCWFSCGIPDMMDISSEQRIIVVQFLKDLKRELE